MTFIIENKNLSSDKLSEVINIPASTIRSVWQRERITKKKIFTYDPDELSSLYKDLKSSRKVAEHYGVDKATILNHLNILNIDTSVNHLLNDKQEKHIISQYYNKTAKELSKEYGVSESLISSIWTKNDLKGKRIYLYDYNISYFNDIQTKDQSYWLGWIASDGCVYNKKNKYITKITLKSDDFEILNVFQKYLKSNKPLNFGKTKDTVTIELVGEEMFTSLSKYNITPNKTWTYRPVILVNNLMSHFIRGYFDGDGSICLLDFNKPSSCSISIVGNYNAICDIHDYLNSIKISCSMHEDKRDKYSDKFAYLSFRNTLEKYCFLKWLYQDCDDLYLNRKKYLADKFIYAVENNLSNKKMINDNAINFYDDYIKIK